ADSCLRGASSVACYRLAGITSAATSAAGPTTTIDIDHQISSAVSRGRSSSGADAISVAPVVENGEASTIDAHTPRALMSAQPETAPEAMSGIASGNRAARMPVVDANAETSPLTRQMKSAATNGMPTCAAHCP